MCLLIYDLILQYARIVIIKLLLGIKRKKNSKARFERIQDLRHLPTRP